MVVGVQTSIVSDLCLFCCHNLFFCFLLRSICVPFPFCRRHRRHRSKDKKKKSFLF